MFADKELSRLFPAFYSTSNSGTRTATTTTYTGNLNINQLLNGSNRYWNTPVQGLEQVRKKTLLIAHYSFSLDENIVIVTNSEGDLLQSLVENNTKSIILIDLMEYLIANGFDIIVWQDPDFIRLTESIHVYKIDWTKLTLQKHDDLKKAVAEQFGLVFDDIHLVTPQDIDKEETYYVSSLLETNLELFQQTIDERASLIVGNHDLKSPRLPEILQKNIFKTVTSFIEDKDDKDLAYKLEQLAKQFSSPLPNGLVPQSMQSRIFKSCQAFEKWQQTVPIHTLILSDFKFLSLKSNTKTILKPLKSLDLEHMTISETDFYNLLNQCPNLEKLTLYDVTFNSISSLDNLDVQPIRLKSLLRLNYLDDEKHFENSYSNAIVLFRLLANNSVQEICVDSSSWNNLVKIYCPVSVKYLTLSNSTYTELDLTTLQLHKLENLVFLKLSYYELLTLSEPIRIPSLKSLLLDNVENVPIENFIAANLQLQCIQLIQCALAPEPSNLVTGIPNTELLFMDGVNWEWPTESFVLPKMTSLTLNIAFDQPITGQRIAESFPNLNYFKISDGEFALNTSIPHQNLRTIWLYNSVISKTDINNLERFYPQLQRIKISFENEISKQSMIELVHSLPLHLQSLIILSADMNSFIEFCPDYQRNFTGMNSSLKQIIRYNLSQAVVLKPPAATNQPLSITLPLYQPQVTGRVIFNVKSQLLTNRLKVYPRLQRNSLSGKLEFLPPLDIMPDDSIQCSHDHHTFANLSNNSQFVSGSCELRLTNEWLPLPSSQIHQNLVFFYTALNVNVVIGYSVSAGLYYIKTENIKEVIVNAGFVYENQELNDCLIPNDLRYFIDYFRSFPLPVPGQNVSLRGITNLSSDEQHFIAIINQKLGACDTRSQAFMWAITSQYFKFNYPINIRLVCNDIHAFVEIKIQDEPWLGIDLGGYPTTINQIDAVQIIPITSQYAPQQLTHHSHELRALFPTMKPHDFLNLSLQRLRGMNCLFDSDTNNTSAIVREVCQMAQRQDYEFLYISHPDELDSPKKGLTWNTETNLGTPGAARTHLSKFLESQSSQQILVINFNAFTPRQLVQWNSIFEKNAQRFVSEYPLSNSCIILGLYNFSAATAYKGSDFIERFSFSYRLKGMLPIAQNPVVDIKPSVTIECYDNDDFETYLIGKWELQSNQLVFKPGELLRYLQEGYTQFTLSNAPLFSDKFRRFLDHLQIDNQITVFGQTINLHQPLLFNTITGYNWGPLIEKVTWLRGLADSDGLYTIINPTTVAQLYSRFSFIEETGQLISQPGFIDACSNNTLQLYITRNISLSNWAELLSSTKKANVQLTILFSPTVQLEGPMASIECTDIMLPTTTHVDSCIARVVTTDNGCAAAIAHTTEDSKLIEISEQPFSNLWATFKNPEIISGGFRFERQIGVIWNFLTHGQTVILYGTYSSELVDALSTLLVSQTNLDETTTCTGRLIVITTDNQFEFVLNNTIERNELDIDKQLTTAVIPLPNYSTEFNISQFQSARYHATLLNNILVAEQTAPVSVALGHTGTGKSTFFRTAFPNDAFYPLERLNDWRLMKNDGHKHRLIIEEANTLGSQLLNFAGLFHNPPSIVYEGAYHELSDQQVVWCLANPNSAQYCERTEPTLWTQYPVSKVLFEPIPDAVLWHTILMPLLEPVLNSSIARTLCLEWLAITRYVNQHFTDSLILITPRELKTMALFILAYRNHFKEYHSYAALYIAYHVVTQVLNKQTLPLFQNWFCNNFNLTVDTLENRHPFITASDYPWIENDEFVSSSAHQPVWNTLFDCLAINRLRQDNPHNYSGDTTSAIILQGASGSGKSKFLQVALTYLGIEFVFIKASDSAATIAMRLREAIQNNQAVILDEFNTMDIPEVTLNELLDNSEILLFATQNAHETGRKSLSNAILRRVQTIKFPLPTLLQQQTIIRKNNPLATEQEVNQQLEYMAGNLRRISLWQPKKGLLGKRSLPEPDTTDMQDNKRR